MASLAGTKSSQKTLRPNEDFLCLKSALASELETLNCLHLPVVRAMKVRLRGSDMRMAHQSLDCLEIIPFIQQSGGEGMPHDMGIDPFLDQRPFYHGSNEAVN